MRNILLIFILCSTAMLAQIPQSMSHRGTAYNSSGAILANKNIGIQVTIKEYYPTTTIVYK